MGIKWDERSESEPGQTVWSALVSFEAFCTCLNGQDLLQNSTVLMRNGLTVRRKGGIV
ncbi:hypothetical protein NSB25_03455 [Acetatifactor muris]|uniref:Uncharacterized protein n=1 Tax=Acetatifactor muris TaxID=879566 RepID=A0A2K4ZCA7_9FIRM|nr:hypothetical protein [Acetatifactor muris]MCR2046334.1 hypothetical protein [Acetatifactor muris]SOY28098.1 hypothetical protein AMURIS_00806 [Acetatifactor muris]